jgi:hypothetical protein
MKTTMNPLHVTVVLCKTFIVHDRGSFHFIEGLKKDPSYSGSI